MQLLVEKKKWIRLAGPTGAKDRHGDISQPCGKIQKTDMDVMRSHATMKTTRKATQNAFLCPCYILLGMSPELT